MRFRRTWPDPSAIPSDGSLGILALSTDQTIFVVTRMIVSTLGEWSYLPKTTSNVLRRARFREFTASPWRTSFRFASLPRGLSSTWGAESPSSLGLPMRGRLQSDRIAELGPAGSEDVCFWQLTDPDHSVQLQDYSPPYERTAQSSRLGSCLFTSDWSLSLQLRNPTTHPGGGQPGHIYLWRCHTVPSLLKLAKSLTDPQKAFLQSGPRIAR